MMGVLDKLEKHEKNSQSKNASTTSADDALMLDEETP